MEMDFLGKILFSKSINTLQLQTADSAEFIVNVQMFLVVCYRNNACKTLKCYC